MARKKKIKKRIRSFFEKYAHLFGGVIVVLSYAKGKKGLALLLFFAFLFYELIEYMQLRDTLWIDVRDFVTGMFVATLFLLVYWAVKGLYYKQGNKANTSS